MTTVSIVIPAFNHAEYLGKAIDSVLAQTFRDVELLVLDDGSTDSTRQVLAAYGKRFHWETQTNMGQAATLNKGWAMTRGDVIGYLSADDCLHPDCVCKSLDVLNADPSVILTYCDFELVDEGSSRVSIVRAPEYCYADMVINGVCPPGPGAFFRRSAHERIGGWDTSYRRIPDYEYWLRLGATGAFRRIPEVLASYRMHDAAQSFSAIGPEQADENIRAVEGLLAGGGLPAEVARGAARARGNARLFAARLHLYSGRVGIGLRRAASAFALAPGLLVRPGSYRILLSGALRRAGQKLVWRLRRAA